MNTGVDTICMPHKAIAEYVSQFDDARSNGSRGLTAKVISNPEGYAISHFELGECMQQKGQEYPFLKAYKQPHLAWLTVLVNFMSDSAWEYIFENPHKLMINWLYGQIKVGDMDNIPSVQGDFVQQDEFVESKRSPLSQVHHG